MRRSLVRALSNVAAPSALPGALQAARNVGIIAHVDAGKTTTTERMLFYAGRTARMGSVDRGDTVTDYLPEERARGITIGAAAATLPWRGAALSLVDTPGHVDFGLEVERALRVVDAALAVVDATRGVEAQTRAVWRTAQRLGVPRLVFVNKMDRPGADFARCVADVQRLCDEVAMDSVYGGPASSPDPSAESSSGNENCRRPSTVPRAVPVQMPIGAMRRNTGAIGDLVACETLVWSGAPDGATYAAHAWGDDDPHGLASARMALVDALADADPSLVEAFAAGGDDALRPAGLRASLGRAFAAGRVVPVLCGAALCNVGVQPVLDALVEYVPPPFLLGDARSPLVALAFKVQHDAQRRALVYVRVYAGELRPGAVLRNTSASGAASRAVVERVGRVLHAFGAELEDVPVASPGSIVVLSGLSRTRTGDTLVSEADAQAGAEAPRAARGTQAVPLRSLELPGICVPPAVFCRSVEPATGADAADVDRGLAMLALEDPSLRVSGTEGSGGPERSVSNGSAPDAKSLVDPMDKSHTQGMRIEGAARTIAGVGELHLEIAGARLVRDLGVRAVLGPVHVAYREAAAAHREVADDLLAVTVDPIGDDSGDFGGQLVEENRVEVRNAPAPDVRAAVQEGTEMALSNGPVASLPVISARVSVRLLSEKIDRNLIALRFAVYAAVRRALDTRLAEPLVAVEVRVPAAHVGAVLADLSGPRRGTVLDTAVLDAAAGAPWLARLGGVLDARRAGGLDAGVEARLRVEVPLQAMLGYAAELRARTAGAGAFTMRHLRYRRMAAADQRAALVSMGVLV